jgi:N-acetylmuramate 1-kinase
MSFSNAKSAVFRLVLEDEAATQRLARDLAAVARPGDIIALSGDLGAGKSTFARAFIRELAEEPTLEVPSPTFTLIQSYDTPRGSVVHADLFRLKQADDLPDTGLPEAMPDAITLIEWPERAGTALRGDKRLDIILELDPEVSDVVRQVELLGAAGWADRLTVSIGSRQLIDKAGWGDARRTFLMGDASTRAYERLVRDNGETAILMISPPRPDGPPIRDGKSYSIIARLAETIDAFVAIDKGLRSLQLSAPEIYAENLSAGLLLLEDLGPETCLLDGKPIPERYELAAQLLARIHSEVLPTILPVTDGRDHVIPEYDREALVIETELLLDWYAPCRAGVTLPSIAKSQFGRCWSGLFDKVLTDQRTWVLRDYHSPNLIWLAEREGLAKVGLIDFQDAVLGHPAYDLVSLTQDARVDVEPQLELRLIAAYVKARQSRDVGFDIAAFLEAYAILGAQRSTKIAGIFARLDRRDGKPGYLKHLPRIESYLRRNLAHPSLAGLKEWYETFLPGLASATTGGQPIAK